MAGKTLNHYTLIKITDPFWLLDPDQQKQNLLAMTQAYQMVGAGINFYQVSPLKPEIDLMVWNALPLEKNSAEAEFFDRLGRAQSSTRRYFQPVQALWGYTKPSVYSKASSSQEIDPFAPHRETYLVLYPFVKTIRWYLLGKDTRQGMMNEHIRIGHQYPDIKQLLLYSFGVQDQEFIVVYEMEDLYRFSELVNELRGSNVREYTQRDTPVYTAVWRSPSELSNLFQGKTEQ